MQLKNKNQKITDKIELKHVKVALENLTNKAFEVYRELGDTSYVSHKFLKCYESFMDTLMKTSNYYGVNHNTKYKIMKFFKKLP